MSKKLFATIGIAMIIFLPALVRATEQVSPLRAFIRKTIYEIVQNEINAELQNEIGDSILGEGFVTSRIRPDFNVVNTSTVQKGLYPDTDKGAELGTTTLRFREASIDNGIFNDITISGTCTGGGCGAGGGGSDSNWTFNSAGFIRLVTTTNAVVLGATATSTASQLEVRGSATIFGGVTASTVNATSSLTVGTLTGIIQGTNGLFSVTSTIGLASGGTGATTAAGARTSLGAAASGANSDITSLSGLTTPLSVPQGGSGAAYFVTNTILLGNGTSAFATTSVLAGIYGGTGLSTVATNQLLIGAAGNTWTQITTSSLGLLTTNVAEGSNLYYTDARVASYCFPSTLFFSTPNSHPQV